MLRKTYLKSVVSVYSDRIRDSCSSQLRTIQNVLFLKFMMNILDDNKTFMKRLGERVLVFESHSTTSKSSLWTPQRATA